MCVCEKGEGAQVLKTPRDSGSDLAMLKQDQQNSQSSKEFNTLQKEGLAAQTVVSLGGSPPLPGARPPGGPAPVPLDPV